MQCPRCHTYLIGSNTKCNVCGYLLNSVVDNKEKEKKNKISNGILDSKDMKHYTQTLDLYKKKNKEINYFIPTVVILVIIIFLIIFAITRIL